MDRKDIRAEYAAISAKITQLGSYRFIIAGFFGTGVGVITSFIDKSTKVHFFLLVLITIAIWIIDIRTRSLLSMISKRGAEIENLWRYSGSGSGWITRMRRKEQGEIKFFLCRKIKPFYFISYSLGLDILFSSIVIIYVLKILDWL